MQRSKIAKSKVAVDEELRELREKVYRKREPKRAATDTRKEYRLSAAGKYWSGPVHGWPNEGKPTFNKAGQKWMSLSRTLQLWAEYNLARDVQEADWPDLELETFEVSIKKIASPSAQPKDLSKLAIWHRKFDRYSPLISKADGLMKSGFDFKYLMEYRGYGEELPSHLKTRVSVVRGTPTYGMGTSEGDYITVAFIDDKDMVFARVALGDSVDLIVDDKGEIIYKKSL